MTSAEPARDLRSGQLQAHRAARIQAILLALGQAGWSPATRGAPRAAAPSRAMPIRSPTFHCAGADPRGQTRTSQPGRDPGSADPAHAGRAGTGPGPAARSGPARRGRHAAQSARRYRGANGPGERCRSGLPGSSGRCRPRRRTAWLGCPRTGDRSAQAARPASAGRESRAPATKPTETGQRKHGSPLPAQQEHGLPTESAQQEHGAPLPARRQGSAQQGQGSAPQGQGSEPQGQGSAQQGQRLPGLRAGGAAVARRHVLRSARHQPGAGPTPALGQLPLGT